MFPPVASQPWTNRGTPDGRVARPAPGLETQVTLRFRDSWNWRVNKISLRKAPWGAFVPLFQAQTYELECL